MKDKRAYTAGIVYDNVFHIFGGYDGSRLKTSEVVSESGITYDSLYNQNHLFHMVSLTYICQHKGQLESRGSTTKFLSSLPLVMSSRLCLGIQY